MDLKTQAMACDLGCRLHSRLLWRLSHPYPSPQHMLGTLPLTLPAPGVREGELLGPSRATAD